jgi:hypothetical protein
LDLLSQISSGDEPPGNGDVQGVPLWGEHLGTPIESRIQISADFGTCLGKVDLDFQPLGVKARAMPIDFSDALDAKRVRQDISEMTQRPIVAYLSLKGISARAIHDDIVPPLGPMLCQIVQLPATFARHDFLCRNQHPIQPTFKEISMIQIKLF